MRLMRRYQSLSAIVLAVALSALLGGAFGRSALATQDRAPENYRVFTEALSAIDANYVDKVESDRLIYSAINGMLGTLDPHSSFMSPKDYAQMRERQEGHYYGLGITIVVIDGDITVASLFEGSPAYKLGVRRGDVIARIAGDDAKGWTSDQAVKKLRGPKGTLVQISLRRRGYDKLIDLEVPRDEIIIPTVRAAFMLDEQTGYVRLQEFAENTDRDLGAALQEMSNKGMRRIVLDLRGNPGGQLDQAIRVTNRFIPRGSLIVYTRGRSKNSDQNFLAVDNGEYTTQPMIVLVNRNSASASEIVSGALQDHDRALVVGETTFGKALVQSVYRITEGAGLALTTAHYFTPAGRLIQRPWDGTFDEYLTYTLRDQDPNRPHNQADLRYTDSGRKVYGGGGIEPDRRFDGPIEGFNPTKFGRLLAARGAFGSYAQKYSAEGDTRITLQAKDRRTVAPNFVVTDAMVKDFRDHLAAERVKIDEDAFAKDLDFIKAMIRYEIDLNVFNVATAVRHMIDRDPQAQFALKQFGEAETLNQMARAKAAAKAGERR
jgi:carboxyl-terminal processing protease